jgi:hypothetical protein
MVVGLSAGNSARMYHWAVFSSGEDNAWRLVFSRHGVPAEILAVRDGGLVELTPVYGPGDPLCCPAARRAAIFDFVDDDFRSIKQLARPYPNTSFERRELVLVRVPKPYGTAGLTPALSATMFRGRAVGFRGYVGATGE